MLRPVALAAADPTAEAYAQHRASQGCHRLRYLRAASTNERARLPQSPNGREAGTRQKPMADDTTGDEARGIPGPESGEFQGFDPPRQNWFKAPNELIDRLPEISSQGELAVVLYCLRHTWGWHQSSARITLDEFEHGRQKPDGSRLDNGTGMSRTAIIRGLKRAMAHGFLDAIEEGPDGGRMSKRWGVRVGGLPADE